MAGSCQEKGLLIPSDCTEEASHCTVFWKTSPATWLPCMLVAEGGERLSLPIPEFHGGHGIMQGTQMAFDPQRRARDSIPFFLAYGPWKVSPQSCVMEIHTPRVRAQHKEMAVLTLTPHTTESFSEGVSSLWSSGRGSRNWVANKIKQTTHRVNSLMSLKHT